VRGAVSRHTIHDPFIFSPLRNRRSMAGNRGTKCPFDPVLKEQPPIPIHLRAKISLSVVEEPTVPAKCCTCISSLLLSPPPSLQRGRRKETPPITIIQQYYYLGGGGTSTGTSFFILFFQAKRKCSVGNFNFSCQEGREKPLS